MFPSAFQLLDSTKRFGEGGSAFNSTFGVPPRIISAFQCFTFSDLLTPIF